MPRPPQIISDKGPKDSWAVIRATVPYFWPEGDWTTKRRVLFVLVFLLASKLVTVITPMFYKAAVDALTKGESSSQAWMLALGAVSLTVAYGMSRIMANGFNQLRDILFAPVSQAALRKLALEVFTHIHHLSLRYHISRKTGGLSRVVERGVKAIAFLLRVLVFNLGALAVELTLIFSVLAVSFGPSFGLVVMTTIALYVLFTMKVTAWRMKIARDMNKQDTEANQKAVDSLLNFETVKYFNAEKREAARYDASMARYEKAAVRTTTSMGFLNFGQAVILNLGIITVMVLAALEVQRGTMSVGDFVMVNAYMIQLQMPLNILGFVFRDVRQSLVDMEDMLDLLHQPPEITDKPGAPDLVVREGVVRLDHVDFGYSPDRQILRDVSIEVPAGHSLAIVGHTGSGKSTIGRLLFRFYDVGAGSLSIDGQDIRDVTQESLHAAIGVVPQDTVLFNDTIRYNIAYGRDGATQAEIEAAAEKAQIHEFITSLPDGYDTQVGERGLKLSGGEKQRVGIARTLLKDPPILLLDEATSALDTKTEQSILGALKLAGEGRTVITIAHRLSTISDSDEIVVLDAGRVLERGTHEALLKSGGHYASMWAAQAEDQDTAHDAGQTAAQGDKGVA
ncbi:ABCB family ABC transporter ATP-binding protein/permease [Celeribacter halophilus]|uniref:ABCB family ABC transporter ATP-binding protein/permease n=1 Tax=Celeribacter halophilus TaxID=576117 RepID=UPI001C086E9D|nr:ABC transporter ATP-binding protein/permease [Celeribacter halophilus]MBU2890462.1 ABC transporter ATP-binding protein/permease [Celeribacter halophilus]MDO6511537.1 ABC transporter ATP-binding protein/permease [Celeribacter halophilus]